MAATSIHQDTWRAADRGSCFMQAGDGLSVKDSSTSGRIVE